MTGRTHDQYAALGALTADLALSLPLDQAGIVLAGAIAFARAPDYTEPLLHVAHRTWTHHLTFGLTVAGAILTAGVLAHATPIAALFAAGALIGCWMHSLMDALTNRGCWLWRRERQVLLPDRWRINVYRVETRRGWLSRHAVTVKRPSRGERCYYWAAFAGNGVLGLLLAVTLAHGTLGATGT